jgi:hypothetical protein
MEKACIALRAERSLVNFELTIPQNGTKILKPVEIKSNRRRREGHDWRFKKSHNSDRRSKSGPHDPWTNQSTTVEAVCGQ